MKQQQKQKKPKHAAIPSLLRRVLAAFHDWRKARLLHRIACIVLALLIVWIGSAYAIARWYIASQADKPLRIGSTFIASYAAFYGLDPKDTLRAELKDLHIRHLRLVSYWDEIEPVEGKYNFEDLDWQFKMADEYGAKVSLAIGLRQPRWPECHMPKWAASQPMSIWAPKLKDFMGAVIDRYKDNQVLESYQLENEFFMTVFGICPDFTRKRLIDEYNFVKDKDPSHPVIISRSNNWIGIPINDPQPDMFGISVYKRVWDKTFTKRYFEYPLPAWFYAFLAGAGKIVTGKDLIVHELQAEAWLPEGFEMNNIKDIPEQNKSINSERLIDRIEYAKATGMKTIDLWGVEWWYWRKVKANDPALWNTAKQELQKIDQIESKTP